MKLLTLILVALTSLVALAQEPKPAQTVDFAELRIKAEKGDADAQLRLGLMYDAGEGVAKDPNEAANWYRKAADQGNASAQYMLGVIYSNGDGAAKDMKEAAKWYRKAADQGDAHAQSTLGWMYGTGEGVAKDPKEALKWHRKAADQGNAKAQHNLALMYANGDGVTKDMKEAAKWYRKAADQGSAMAQQKLGEMYAKGKGVAKDPMEAVNWYRKAADQGDANAQRSLATMFVMGDGAAKDMKEAAKWYRKAAEQGDAYAQTMLGTLYETGEGVLKDELEALAWLNISAISGYKTAVEGRNGLERRLGQQAALVAQQRSKEILKQIETNKARTAGNFAATFPIHKASGGAPKSSGSGAIVSSSGHILTAAHVVANATSITVITAQGSKTATVERVDESNDLAVLKLSGGTYPALPVAPSRRIRLGQVVATIGFPNIGIQGFSPKLTRGEISSLSGIADDPRSWQISVPVQPGNSGRPLLDENGNLIGVVVAKLGLEAAKATGDLPQNVGYAVKSAYALALLEPYLDSGAPEPNAPGGKTSFEDMVAKAQRSVVLILVY